jgi:glyoxylase-like metal-dependent hydrolase (beta-lactamase superfamily II)
VIRIVQHDDVTVLQFSWRRSRAVGYSVQAYFVRSVLIDSGFPAAQASFASWLRENSVRGALITHHHEDHAGNLRALAEHGIPVGADPRTVDYAARRQRIPFYRRFTWQSPRPTVGAVHEFHDDTLRLIATPGHSADHHAVWDDLTGTLFAADLYLGTKVRLAHASEDPRALLTSLRAMIARAPARVFCSHRGLLPRGVAQLASKADWLEQTIQDIDTRIAAGWTDVAIRRDVLGARPMTHWFSQGEYSPDNMVRALRATSAQ